MAPQARRSAALLISVHVDSEANPRWHARIASYRDAFGSPVALDTQVTVDGVSRVLRAWLLSVIEEKPVTGT